MLTNKIVSILVLNYQKKKPMKHWVCNKMSGANSIASNNKSRKKSDTNKSTFEQFKLNLQVIHTVPMGESLTIFFASLSLPYILRFSLFDLFFYFSSLLQLSLKVSALQNSYYKSKIILLLESIPRRTCVWLKALLFATFINTKVAFGIS